MPYEYASSNHALMSRRWNTTTAAATAVRATSAASGAHVSGRAAESSVRRDACRRFAQVLGGIDALCREVMLQHLADELFERRLGFPAELLGRLAGVSAQLVDFGRPQVGLIAHHVLVPVEAGHLEGRFSEFAYRAHDAVSDDEIV